MKGIVSIDPHSAVQVLRRQHDTMARCGRKELRDRDLGVRRSSIGNTPGRLLGRQPDGFGIDVGIGCAMANRLKHGDGLVELLTGLDVFGRQRERGFATARRHRTQPRGRA